jgi:3-oxosteroid 1-dehydrogenase
VSDIECDVAVFGSGAAGMSAALVAACEGLSVAVFEKAAQLGGTTATSGGAIWIPGSSQSRRAGVQDSIEDARRYLRGQIGAPLRTDLLDAYLASGPEAVDYLEQRTELRFEYVPLPDYVTDADGAVDKGRALAPQPFDGARLGRDFALVLPPREAFMLLGGLMVGRKEIPMLLAPFASLAALRAVVRLLARHAWDRLCHPRGTRLLLGNALIARAVFSARRLGVDLHVRHALKTLVQDRGRVIGARVDTPAGPVKVRARRAVVLAMGGFPHCPQLREQLAPHHPHRHSLASPGNTGDAIRAAVSVGAALDADLPSPGFWTPASVAPDGRGGEIVYPYGHLDRGKPGAIIVDATGRRFVNESDSYHHVVLGMFRAGAVPPQGRAFIVCDHRFISRYGLGLVKPAPFPHRAHLRSGYLRRAATLDGLAAQLGVDADALKDEVGRHNRHASIGHDPDFGKGATAFNRYNGDDRGQPNACLLPLDQPPYYAIAIHPCTLGTAVGLRTDADARVLDTHSRPIEGLYACGNDMGSVFRGTYPGPGITIGPARVFAYRAMRHAAAAGARPPVTSPATRHAA